MPGIAPLADYTGQPDGYGYMMQASVIAAADELASAAELVMGKVDAVPVATTTELPDQARWAASAWWIHGRVTPASSSRGTSGR